MIAPCAVVKPKCWLPSLKSLFRSTAAFAVMLYCGSYSSAGYTITFTNTTSDSGGTGFGSVISILTLQQQGNATTEWGGVGRSGGVDTYTGDASPGAPHSQTLTAAYIQALTGWTSGGVDFNVIFQVNQAGSDPSVDLHTFQLDFYTNTGGIPFATAVYVNGAIGPHQSLNLTGVGTGTSGWVFNVHLDSGEATAFFSNSTNRLGMSVAESNPIRDTANDGPDNFYVTAREGNIVTVQSVPAPPSAIAALSGLAIFGLVGFSRLRRRPQPVLAA